MNVIALPSVQSLLIHMRFSGQALSVGTAFVVDTAKGPHLITNRHNVTGRRQDTGVPISPTGGVPNEIVIIHNVKGKLGHWMEKTEPLYKDDAPLWREHPVLGPRADFVALPLTDLAEVEIFPYSPEAPGALISVGAADTISVIGFPFGLSAGGAFGVWATGFVASEPIVNYDNLPIMLIDCRSRQGQSGSPVIAYRSGGMVPMENGDNAAFTTPVWRFMGIYSGRINGESDIGIVWKASAIQELLVSL